MDVNEFMASLGLDSGLPDDFDATITDAVFRFNPEYQEGQILRLSLTLSRADGGDDYNLEVNVGQSEKGWDVADRGASAIRTSDKGTGLPHKNSGVSVLLRNMAEAGASDVLAERMRAGSSILSSALYTGLTFHWNQVEVDYGGEIGVRDKLIPTAFISATGASSVPVDPALISQVDALADAAAEYDEFVATATEALGDDFSKVESYVKDLAPSGAWAQAVARAE